jgi:TatD DNase family protein
MELVDTHCHIQSIDNINDPINKMWHKEPGINTQQVLDDANKIGVVKMICVGTDVQDSELAVEFANQHDGCFASVGVHPHEAEKFLKDDQAKTKFEALLKKSKIVAIGECGLDYYYNHSSKEAQIELLEYQLDLAVKHNLPVIFHIREAFDDFWPIIQKYSAIRGVIHSFSDNFANAKKALDKEFYIGVNGIATFSKNDEQIEAYKNIPVENLLLETDAPFLAPKPHRGTVNQPKRVSDVCDFLCQLRGESREKLATATTTNANKLFGI